jgi:hypothetical protein
VGSFGTYSMVDNEEIDDDVVLSLNFSATLTGGVSDEWLEDAISRWELILGMFDKKVLECKELI